MRELLVDLIRIPSTFECESAIVARVAEEIIAGGCTPEFIPHQRERLASHPHAQRPISAMNGRNSIAVRLRGTGTGRSLAINTHLDVVPAGPETSWTHPPFAGFIDEERDIVYGRGAMDDKAGVVIALTVMETLAKSTPLAGDVIFHFVLEDETTGNGTLLCLESGFTADAALIADGTRPDKAIDRHAGHMQFSVRVQGKPASVSVPHMGVNAAETLAALMLSLKNDVGRLNEHVSAPWNRLPSPLALIAQSLACQGEQGTLPETAEARFWMTFPPPWTLANMRERVMRGISDFLEKNAPQARASCAWDGFQSESVGGDAGMLAHALRETARLLGMPPIDVGPSTGFSDMRHFSRFGIPCLLYGPGTGYNPHRADEHYYLDDLPRMTAFYLAFIQRWCIVATHDPCDDLPTGGNAPSPILRSSASRPTASHAS
jgi:acetylornithine deacetylase